MSRSKAKGTAWETNIVRCLIGGGWHRTERRTTSGRYDKGDIQLHPDIVIEAKDHGVLNFSGWLKEAEVERVNADAEIGFVWAKRRGKGLAEDGYVVMDGTTLMFLLRKAGY